VRKLDRLGKSLKHLIETLNLLKGCEIDFISLTEKFDTTTQGRRGVSWLVISTGAMTPAPFPPLLHSRRILQKGGVW
jgi:Resolvase, N terminal domain